MEFFDEISKVKKDFPKFNSVTSDVKEYELNFYQIFAIGLFILFFFIGIVLGNLFATCEATSYFYSDACVVTQFNYSLMIVIWFCGTLLSILLFSIGHIITLLSEISEKLSKNKWYILHFVLFHGNFNM